MEYKKKAASLYLGSRFFMYLKSELNVALQLHGRDAIAAVALQQ